MLIRNTVMTAALRLCVFSGWSVKSLAQEIRTDGSKAAELAISAFRIPDGMKMDVFAAGPQVARPRSICIDKKIESTLPTNFTLTEVRHKTEHRIPMIHLRLLTRPCEVATLEMANPFSTATGKLRA